MDRLVRSEKLSYLLASGPKRSSYRGLKVTSLVVEGKHDEAPISSFDATSGAASNFLNNFAGGAP